MMKNSRPIGDDDLIVLKILYLLWPYMLGRGMTDDEIVSLAMRAKEVEAHFCRSAKGGVLWKEQDCASSKERDR